MSEDYTTSSGTASLLSSQLAPNAGTVVPPSDRDHTAPIAGFERVGDELKIATARTGYRYSNRLTGNVEHDAALLATGSAFGDELEVIPGSSADQQLEPPPISEWYRLVARVEALEATVAILTDGSMRSHPALQT